MEKKDKWLVNDYIRIKNPLLLKKNCINHEGLADDFNFKTQQKNYEILKETLAVYGVKFNKVYATRWSTNGNLENPNKYVFVVEANLPVVWYKYESDGYGSSQNYLYLGKTKIKLSEWLNAEDIFRKNYIENMLNN